MKKFNLLLSALFTAFTFGAFAQAPTSTLFYENFDDPNNIQMVDSSTTGLNSWGLHWLNVSAPNSDSGRVMYKDTIFLTSPKIDINGKKSVTIEFDHVAKIHNLDLAKVQFSLDSMQTWTDLTGAEHQSGSVLQKYTGDPYTYLFNELSALGLNNKWHFGTTPQQIGWQPTAASDFVHEIFEISNHLNTSTRILHIRFVLGDNIPRENNSTNPNAGRAGWWVDNIEVKGAECLLISPEIDLDPPNNYINQYIGSVYWQGPYDFTAQVTDGEGVESVKLYYKINNGPEKVLDFTNLFGATYAVNIPASEVQIGDTVCWRIEAIDVTDCENTEIYPNATVGCHEFEVRRDLPKGCETTPKNQYPYVEDFNAAQCVVGTSGTLCNDWTNASGDFGDWYINVGNTPTPGTGPSTDYPGAGKYLYIESDHVSNNFANLKSPCLDFYEIENPNVRFYLNTYGQSTGEFHVDLITFDGPTVLDVIPPFQTTTTPGWQQVELNLYQYRNKIVQLRFRGKTGFNNLSDIGFDSLSIFNSPLVDISAVGLNVDELAPASTQDSVEVVVRNLGVFPIDSMNVYLSYNEQPFSPTPVLVDDITINPSETKSFKVKANEAVPLGEYNVRAIVRLFENATEGDGRIYNDTTPLAIGRGLPTVDMINNNEYFDSFEDTVKMWTPYPFNNFNTNNWEWGYPNYGYTTGAYDGNYAWDVNLNVPNTNWEETSFLISPFMDLSNADSLMLQFQQNRTIDMEDLFFIQFSRDRGETWEFLPQNATDPRSKNWYNATQVLPSNEIAPGWEGTSLTRTETDGQRDFWKLSELDISVLADPTQGRVDEILLRFGFYDKAVPPIAPAHGVSVDAVRISKMYKIDVAPLEIHLPYSDCSEQLGRDEPVQILVENFGRENLQQDIPVEVNVYKDNQPGIDHSFNEDMISSLLQPRETMVYKFSNTVDLNIVGQWYTIEVITQLPGDQNPSNDTIRKRVENIDGCLMRLVLTPNTQKPAMYSPGHHQFYIDGEIPEYPSYVHHKSAAESGNPPWLTRVCARDGSEVLFELYDPYTAGPPQDLRNIVRFSILIDLIGVPILDRNAMELKNVPGGSKTVGFTMDCPPIRSTVVDNSSLRVIDSDILPTAKNYNFELTWRNMGIEKIGYVEMEIWVDEDLVDTDTVIFPSATTGDSIPYGEYYQHIFSDVFVEPGKHTIMAVMSNPNQLFDEEPWDDTARLQMSVVDTSYTDIDSTGYHTSFEDGGRPQWVSLNPYTYTTNSLFEKGTPNKSLINGASDGNIAWVTDLDDPYRPFDSSSVVSPYFLFEKDVCYSISFDHAYAFGDNAQDGGNFQYSIDTGKTWVTITVPSDTTGADSLYLNWNNVHHIAAIPKNDVQDPSEPFSYYNSGWSGISKDSTGGYVQSKAPLGFWKDQYVIFRFNFESDGPPNGDGWAVDNFNIDTISAGHCMTVGIEELLAKHAFILGNNMPNPFSSQSLIPVYIPSSGEVTVDITNMLGQPVCRFSETMAKGEHLIPVQSDNWSSGIYYYTVSYGGERQTKKMMITK